MSNPTRVTSLTFLASALLQAPVAAQDLWPEPRREATVDFEWVRPRIDGTDLGTFAGLYRLSVAVPVDAKARAVVVVPYTVADIESPFAEDENAALGNIYVGAEIGPPGGTLTGQLGAYLPTTPDDAYDPAILGFLGDFDRLEAYLPNSLSMRAGIQYRRTDPGGILYGFRFGGSGIAPTGGGGGSAELIIDYGLIFGVQTEWLRLAATVDGRFGATAGAGIPLGDLTVHQAGFEAVLLGWRVEPRLIVRVPMDEQLDGVGPMVGVGLTARLGR
jgi:hypothetical protein